MKTRHFSLMRWGQVAGVMGVGILLACAAARAQSTSGQQAQPDDLIKLNRGMAAYLQENYDEAREILEQLRAEEPNNAACLYYLGLIYLDQGLAYAGQEKHEQARESFAQAQGCLEGVLRLAADPGVTPVEAVLSLADYNALLPLGIAQLAREDPAKRDEARDLAHQAAKTLQDYVETDEGRNDRHGHFFLAVAHYRLCFHEDPAGHARAAAEALRLAKDLAGVDAKRGVLAAAELQTFETRVLYYQGLIDVAQNRRGEALTKLRQVIERGATGEELVLNAEDLVEHIEHEQKAHPSPMVLDSPLGPLRFEGAFALGYFYDSNVILLGEDTALPRGIVQKWDHRFGVEASFDVSRQFTEQECGLGKSLLLGLGGQTSHLWQPSIAEFDINLYGGRAYINWEALSDLFLGLQYDYSYSQLGHDPFISSNRITPVISKIWRGSPAVAGELGEPRARTDIYYSYDYRDYLDELVDFRFDRDGPYHAVGIKQTFNLWRARDLWHDYYAGQPDAEPVDFRDGERWLALRLGYVHRNERTQGDEFDLVGHTIQAGLDVPLPYRLMLAFRTDLSWDGYNHPSLLDYRRNERRDFIQRYDFGLTRTFVDRGESASMPTLQVRLRAGVEFGIQDSNIWNRLSEDVYSYDRAIYSLKLMVNF
jgi:tetratricopeptide (TPR) repeat protein